MPTEHSLSFLGGSTAARTIRCPGWRKLAKTLPVVDNSSDAANEGSMLHDCAELVINEERTAYDLIGYEAYGVVLTEELYRDKLLPAIEAFNRYIKDETSGDVEFITEESVALPGIADAWGTADILLFDHGTQRLHIMDWKFGYMVVSPNLNDQLAFYGNGALNSAEIADWAEACADVALVIIQGGLYDHWVTDKKWLQSRLHSFIAATTRDETCLGDHCKFCPAMAALICPEHDILAAGALDTTTKIALDSDLAYWMDKAYALEDFIKAVRAAGHSALEAGADVEGFKLVAKRATRAWKDEADTDKKLRQVVRRKSNSMSVSDMYISKLKSPAQTEALLKKHGLDKSELSDFIESRSSGNTVARESDKRPELPGLKGLAMLGKL